MLAFIDKTEALDEPKSARMDLRTKARVKETIEQAAALLGADTSSFVTNAAYECARETIEAHERTVLHAEDREVFFAALESPDVPSDKLREALKLHRNRVEIDK